MNITNPLTVVLSQFLHRLTRIPTGVLLLGLAISLYAADVKNGFDVSAALVPADEILWGGVRRDGIPSIDSPVFVKADDAGFLRDTDRVIGIEHNGVARAYPVRILDRHEIVNDRFGDDAIVVTYCPLCFSGMAFAVNALGPNLTFGVSGLLYNSDVLLYDRQTGSLWSQIRSQAISGPLQGRRIPAIPAAHTTWRQWRERHPDTQVLSTHTGFPFRYTRSPYRDYQRSRRLMFPVANRSNAYGNKDLVLGVRIGDTGKAYPIRELRRYGKAAFTDTVAGTELIIEWSADDNYARALDSDGNEISTVIVYWFAWYAFHPDTSVFQAGSG